MMSSMRKRKIRRKKVNLREPLLSRLEGMSAKTPLDRPEKKPLASSPLRFWEPRLLSMGLSSLTRDSAGGLIWKGIVSSLKSSLY